jgi:hypothetical protein
MKKLTFGVLFLLFLVLSCAKTEDFNDNGKKVFVRAVASDQRVKLYFYSCNYEHYTFPVISGYTCTPDPNAHFDVYQLHPDGTEKAKVASSVTDSFYMEGLPNRVNAYFKVKSRIGRTYTAESDIVIVTPGVYQQPERLTVPNLSNPFEYPYYSPDLNKLAQEVSNDTFSGVQVTQFNPPQTRYAPISFIGQMFWDASSRYFMGTTYYSGAWSDKYVALPFLYDTETDSLTLYDDLGNHDFPASVLAPDLQRFYFLSNQQNFYDYGLWTANIDGSQKRRLAPEFKFNYVLPDNKYNRPIVSLTCSNDGAVVYANFFSHEARNDQDGLYQINPITGDFVRLLDNTWQVQSAQPSPDHRRVVFLSYRSGESAFWLYDLSTGEVRQAAVLPFDLIYFFSNPISWADNEHIVFSVYTATGYVPYKVKLLQ